MILHVDMDAFYASVEERERPECRGRPVIGGDAGAARAVSAANYAARRYGVHAAMPMATARRLCPMRFISTRGSATTPRSPSRSERFSTATRRWSSRLSLDEAFLDVSGSVALFGPAVEIGRRIKDAIRREL